MTEHTDSKVIDIISEDEKRGVELILKDYEMSLETQRHFNDLILRFRSIGFTIIGVLLSAGLGASSLHPLISVGILIVTFVLLKTFRDFDRKYYHKLLLGGVEKNKKLDKLFENTRIKVLGKECRILGLAEYITKSVRGQLDSTETPPAESDRKGTQKHTSELLIDKFYGNVRLMIFGLIIIMLSWWIYADFISAKSAESGRGSPQSTIEVHYNE